MDRQSGPWRDQESKSGGNFTSLAQAKLLALVLRYTESCSAVNSSAFDAWLKFKACITTGLIGS